MKVGQTMALVDEDAMLGFGEKFAEGCQKEANRGLIIYLTGTLGAGKTTFVRGFLRGLNYLGPVKSPTYTIIEPYDFLDFSVFHFDFYRLQGTAELEWMGARDFFKENSICLMEWPELVADGLPSPDLAFNIEMSDSGRQREVQLRAASALGRAILKCQHA